MAVVVVVRPERYFSLGRPCPRCSARKAVGGGSSGGSSDGRSWLRQACVARRSSRGRGGGGRVGKSWRRRRCRSAVVGCPSVVCCWRVPVRRWLDAGGAGVGVRTGVRRYKTSAEDGRGRQRRATGPAAEGGSMGRAKGVSRAAMGVLDGLGRDSWEPTGSLVTR
jgi:hypothetical protein